MGLQQHEEQRVRGYLGAYVLEYVLRSGLVRLFPAPAVLGSYLNLTIAASAAALVLIVATRGRIGYRPETDASEETVPLPR